MFFLKKKEVVVRTLNCPACRTLELSPFEWKGITVDICPKCHGIWFDYAEMKAIEESDTLQNIDEAFAGTYQDRPVSESMLDAARICPLDSIELNRYEWFIDSKIVMDGCPECKGIFLDAGELEGYVAFLKAQEEHPARMTDEMRATLKANQRAMEMEIAEWSDNAMAWWGPVETVMDKLFYPKAD